MIDVGYRSRFNFPSIDAFYLPDHDSRIVDVDHHSAPDQDILAMLVGFQSLFLPFGIVLGGHRGVGDIVRSDALFSGGSHSRLGYPWARRDAGTCSKVVVTMVEVARWVCR